MTVNMEVGLCHPPVGLNLYVASGIARMGITELTIATWPWLVTMLVFLVMVTYIPEMSLWLPHRTRHLQSFVCNSRIRFQPFCGAGNRNG
jgi:TRAP-type C4-dicarboxylate transport system permease large subunit